MPISTERPNKSLAVSVTLTLPALAIKPVAERMLSSLMETSRLAGLVFTVVQGKWANSYISIKCKKTIKM